MFGAHLSIAGGLHNALTRAEELGCGTTQIFTKNQQQWHAPALTDDAIALWKAELAKSKFEATVSHASYLINLASTNPITLRRSIDLMIEEIRRCHLLSIPFLVVHPGAHMGEGEDAGLARVAKSLDEIHRAIPEARKTVTTCLEITAGQGSCLGCTLEHLGEIISRAKQSKRLGVCLDTAHLWAAGYDWRGRKYSAFKKQLDKTIGIERMKVWHVNDSKKDLGSRVDRHDHVGRGKIGLEGFKPIVRDRDFKNVPKVFELPLGDSDVKGKTWEEINLKALRDLM